MIFCFLETCTPTIPSHIMQTRSSQKRKPGRFKVSPYLDNLAKNGKHKTSEVYYYRPSILSPWYIP